MLEAEHPAHDWWEAYQILQQNNDTKQSTMMMLIYHQNLHWLKSRQISGLAHKVRFSSCQEQYGESPSADVDVFAQVPMGVLWPKLVICKANNDNLDYNFALTLAQEVTTSHNTSLAFVCCAPDEGLPRDRASNGQHGFLEELFYRTDLACHAGHGCGGTHSEGCGGTLSFPGISIFREGVSKGYQQFEVAQMHLVLAQHSVQSGGIQEASEIKEQLRKSIALSLKAAHKEKDTALVISGSCLSAQGEEIVSSEAFAELLREVLIADMMQSGDGQFNCIFITMTSTQQEEVFHRCFQEWESKNLISVATQMDSIIEAASNDATHIDTAEKLGGTRQASQNEELVLVRPPQVDKVTLATWLDSSGFDDDDLLNQWSEEDDEGRELSWSQCPEAIMVHSTKLTEVILNKISHELKSLARWMIGWDQQVESQDINDFKSVADGGSVDNPPKMGSVMPGIQQKRAVAQNSRIKSVCSLPGSTEPSWIGQHQKVVDSNSGRVAIQSAQQPSCVQFVQFGRRKNARWTFCTRAKRTSRPRTTYQLACSLACRSTFQF